MIAGRKKHLIVGLSMMAFSLCHASSAHLEGPPQSSAGIVEKQIQKEYQVEEISPTKELPILEVDIPKKTLEVPKGISVVIDKVVFQGNLSIKDNQLQKIAAPYLGRQVHGQDIRELCQAIQSYYVNKGYILARVFPPEQNIEDHTLTIEVMEGILGTIRVEGNKYYGSKYIKKYLTPYEGKSINYHQIIRALLLLNENMDLSVGAVFKKGQSKGEADLVLVVKDTLPFHIYSDVNNYGSSITTLYRAGTRVDYGNLVTSGDKLSLVEVIGFPPDHLNYSNAVYSIPLNGKGTRLALSYLYSGFKVDRLNELHLKGTSNIAGVRITQALARTRRLSTDVFFDFDYKQLKNKELGETASYDKLRVIQLGMKMDYIDTVKGRNSGDLYFSVGIPDFLGGLSAVDSQCSRNGAGARYYILNLDFQRIQQLPMDCFLLLNTSAQGTLNKLPISEQFYVGGIDTVRGYPLATALGDNGYCASLELSIPPPFIAYRHNRLFKKEWKDILRFIGFVDHGGVFDNGYVFQEKDPSYITSSGVGLRIYGPWNFYMNFDAGFPLTKDHKSSNTILYFKLGLKII